VASLHASTVLLLSLWTLWLLIVLSLIPEGPARGALPVAFGVLAVVLVPATDVSWRTYLISWLAAAAVLAGDRAAARRSRGGAMLVVAAGSVVGALWLWVGGGAAYWRWVVGAVAAVMALGGAAAAGYGCREWVRTRVTRAVQQERASQERRIAGANGEIERLTTGLADREAEIERMRWDQRAALAAAEQNAASRSAQQRRLQWEVGAWQLIGGLRASAGEQTPRSMGVYRCPDCKAVWLLVASTPGALAVHGPLPPGGGCDTCAVLTDASRQPRRMRADTAGRAP
jgi:hypothetical protein